MKYPASRLPKVLRVETARLLTQADGMWAGVVDYSVYDNVPRWWRRLEEWLHLDIVLAIVAKKRSKNFDVVWAGSELVSIPLSLIGLSKPLITVVHHPESPWKARLLRWTRLPRKWAGIGLVAPTSLGFMMREFGLPPHRFFQYFSVALEDYHPTACPSGAARVVSVGVAKRDYWTLVEALRYVPQCETEIFAGSRYGDTMRGRAITACPPWVTFRSWVTDEQLIEAYNRARVVVVPLESTTHSGAGASVALEAAASGRAVVATDTAGMRSFVLHGKTGLLVPPNDVEAMTDAIKLICGDSILANAMGLAGRQFVESNFDRVVVNRGIERFIASVANRGHQK